jgi:hypothetical protein
MRAKPLLIAAAGLNLAAYHTVIGCKSGDWQTPALTPRPARAAGGLSLGLWIAVVACGRWIGFSNYLAGPANGVPSPCVAETKSPPLLPSRMGCTTTTMASPACRMLGRHPPR